MIFMIFSISDLVLKSVLLSTGNNLITKSRHRSRSARVMEVVHVVRGWRWNFPKVFTPSTHILWLTPPCFSRVANKGGYQNTGRRRRKFSGVFRSFAVGNRPETIDFEQKSCSADLYFKNFSPAALLKPPKSSILVKSPPQAEKNLGLRPTFG